MLLAQVAFQTLHLHKQAGKLPTWSSDNWPCFHSENAACDARTSWKGAILQNRSMFSIFKFWAHGCELTKSCANSRPLNVVSIPLNVVSIHSSTSSNRFNCPQQNSKTTSHFPDHKIWPPTPTHRTEMLSFTQKTFPRAGKRHTGLPSTM